MELNDLRDAANERPTDRLVGAAFAVVVLLWLAWIGLGLWLLADSPKGSATSLELAGSFGDLFGSLNALFTALAFVAVWWTGRMQRQELEFQREELRLQRQELELTRGELSRTATAQEQQLLDAAKASERTLRAYINAVVATCNWSEGAYQSIEVSVEFKNYGRTPGYQFATAIEVAFGKDENSLPSLPVAGSHVGVVAPGATIRSTVSKATTEESLHGLARGELNVYVRGIAQYTDAFGARRTLTFAVWTTGDKGISTTPSAMFSCTTGNDAD